MAAYAYTIDKDQRFPERFHDSIRGLLSGSLTITNYNGTTKPKIAEISQHFIGDLKVVAGISSNGYVIEWDEANSAFSAFATGAASGAALVEVADDVDVGSFQWIAIGRVM